MKHLLLFYAPRVNNWPMNHEPMSIRLIVPSLGSRPRETFRWYLAERCDDFEIDIDIILRLSTVLTKNTKCWSITFCSNLLFSLFDINKNESISIWSGNGTSAELWFHFLTRPPIDFSLHNLVIQCKVIHVYQPVFNLYINFSVTIILRTLPP